MTAMFTGRILPRSSLPSSVCAPDESNCLSKVPVECSVLSVCSVSATLMHVCAWEMMVYERVFRWGLAGRLNAMRYRWRAHLPRSFCCCQQAASRYQAKMQHLLLRPGSPHIDFSSKSVPKCVQGSHLSAMQNQGFMIGSFLKYFFPPKQIRTVYQIRPQERAAHHSGRERFPHSARGLVSLLVSLLVSHRAYWERDVKHICIFRIHPKMTPAASCW